jgi:hypothetical protein
MAPTTDSRWCRLVHRFVLWGWTRTATYYPDAGFFSAYTITRSRCRWCGRCYTSGRQPANQM